MRSYRDLHALSTVRSRKVLSQKFGQNEKWTGTLVPRRVVRIGSVKDPSKSSFCVHAVIAEFLIWIKTWRNDPRLILLQASSVLGWPPCKFMLFELSSSVSQTKPDCMLVVSIADSMWKMFCDVILTIYCSRVSNTDWQKVTPVESPEAKTHNFPLGDTAVADNALECSGLRAQNSLFVTDIVAT